MSGAATWLHGQRKTELVDLAEKVGLKDYSALKKSELEDALDQYMRANQSTLSKDTSLSQYFKRITSSSPIVEKTVAKISDVVKTPATKQRRQTKAKDEIEADRDASENTSTSTAVVAKTPKAVRPSFAASVPLPPSPAVVANEIERQSQRVKSRLNEAYAHSGVSSTIDDVRDRMSTTAFVETVTFFMEAIGVAWSIMPFKSFMTVTAPSFLGSGEVPIKVPDAFVLLTAGFWATLTLWLLTSAALPLTAAYFINPSLKARRIASRSTKDTSQYDLATFNVAKALIAYVVYGIGLQMLGYPSSSASASVVSSLAGGLGGIFISSGIGAFVALYEAVLRK